LSVNQYVHFNCLRGAPLFLDRSLDNAHHLPCLSLRHWPALPDRNLVAGLALVRLVVRHHLAGTANVLAVNRVLDQAFDGDRYRLVHLVADHASLDDALGLLVFGTSCLVTCFYCAHFASSCRFSSFITVFIRAISLRTRPCSCGRDSWPVACCIRRLNCSRRSFSNSLPSCSCDIDLSSLAFITSPAALRRSSGMAAWPQPGGTPPARFPP